MSNKVNVGWFYGGRAGTSFEKNVVFVPHITTQNYMGFSKTIIQFIYQDSSVTTHGKQLLEEFDEDYFSQVFNIENGKPILEEVLNVK